MAIQDSALQALVVEVRLSVEGRSPTRHTTRDVGLGGILLDAGVHNGLKLGMAVEVMFAPGHTICARVASMTDGTVALVYRKLSSNDVVFLNELLRSLETVDAPHTESQQSVASA